MRVYLTNNLYSGNTNFQNPTKRKKYQPTFESKPLNLPKMAVYGAYDAMVLYGFLKLGSYLDAGDDDISPSNKSIRKENLSFLDEIYYTQDKKDFISHYQEVTGFPNLKLVSEKIEKEFVLGAKKSSIGLYYGDVIAAGYDDTCSVGKRKAFPGSDLDKAFIIIRGSGNLDRDKFILEKYKGNLWHNVDQRILSFNHDISFPTVYTIAQIKDKLKKINQVANELSLDESHFRNLVKNEYIDLEKAAEFNILLSKEFDTYTGNTGKLSKDDVKNFAYFIESIRDGKNLISSARFDMLKSDLERSKFYKFSNVAQIKAVKNAIKKGREYKTKILLREKLEKDFQNWDVSKQFDFIKTLIKYSCEDEDNFQEYFKNDRNVKEKYKPLLNILTMGDRSFYNLVEFKKIDNGLNIKYGDDFYVNIYPGYSKEVLWIDSQDLTAIKQVLRNIDKIKQHELFADINRVQCPVPYLSMPDFYYTRYKTANGTTIIERQI